MRGKGDGSEQDEKIGGYPRCFSQRVRKKLI